MERYDHGGGAGGGIAQALRWALITLSAFSAVAAASDNDAKSFVGSSVRIVCFQKEGGATGSGFVVGDDGKFVLTNSHVVDQCQRIVVMSPRDSGEPRVVIATTVWNSRTSMTKRNLDAALLSLAESIDRPGVRFSSHNTVLIQDPVVAVGYPAAADEPGTSEAFVRPSITQGMVSRIFIRRSDGEQAAEKGVGLYQITASIGPGSSGGPLFNEYGEVIGINTEKSLVAAATVSEQGDLSVQRLPLQDGVAWSQEIDDLLPILSERGIRYRVTSERRGWFSAWFSHNAVTAGAIGGLGALLLLTIGALLWRRPGGMSVATKGGQYVEGLTGPYAGNRFALDADLVFGRDARSCNVVFASDQDGIGARHCSLRFDPLTKTFELRDLASANGTFVNGRRVSPGMVTRLKDGDEFYLFRSKYRFAVYLGQTGNAHERHAPA